MRSTQAILGQDFTVKSHLRFAFPRMMMSLFIMSYVVADGALISYYLGTVALASLNMVFPLAGFLSAIGMMLSAGGGSVVSRRLGDQRAHDADRALSTIVYANIVIGIVLAAIGLIFVDDIPRQQKLDLKKEAPSATGPGAVGSAVGAGPERDQTDGPDHP